MNASKKERDGLLAGVVAEPHAEDRWSVLADWLEEYDDPRRSELLRLHRRLLATCLEPDRPERQAWQVRLVELLAAGVEPCVPRETILLGDRRPVPMEFAFVPPGTFLMGSPPGELERQEDEVQHRVTLATGFYLGVHPVTQAQWRAVVGTNPSKFKGKTLPVGNVSWDDCQTFCENLGRKTDGRFRLPTEAEWEYACRAGTTSPFSFGDTISTDMANYDGNYAYGDGKKGVYRQKTTPVGKFPANAWGLHDIHGNVWEWCADWYGPVDKSDETNPEGPQSGVFRLLRGGSWCYYPQQCRAAYRYSHDPALALFNFGCRVLLCLD